MTAGQDNILAVLRHALSDELSSARSVLVGLSGGMDSVVLLHALAQLRVETPFPLSALHVHHGLSPQADAWAEFCRSLCRALNVPCEVVRVQLPAAAGKGIERVAREARYAAFTAAAGDILCLAHHQNDRAETFLLNLFRGAGSLGLAGVPSARMLGDKRLLRPFIDTPRAALLAWATSQRLHWVEDESNDDWRFRRNEIRHRLLPIITAMFPGAISVLARTAAQMGEQAELLGRLAELDSESSRDASGYLSIARLQQLPEPAVRNVLRHALFKAGVQIPAAKRLETLAGQLMTAKNDSEVLVRMGAVGVHLWRDHLWLDRAIDQSCPAPCDVETGRIEWPDGWLVIHAGLGTVRGIQVRPVGSGQRFQPMGRCRDTVSELLRAQGVPPWVRPRLPGLWHDGRLVWVTGLGWRHEQRLMDSVQQQEIRWEAAAPALLA